MSKESFFSQGVYGCVSYPRLSCDGSQTTDKKKQVSKVVVNNDYAINELHIGELIHTKIKKAPKHMFVYFEKSCNIEKYQFKKSNKLLKKCKLFHNKTEETNFIILYGPYISSITLYEYWKEHFNYQKLFHFYGFMLRAIHLLIKQKIVHNDLKTNNILVHKNNLKKLSIVDFGISIDIKKCLKKNALNYKYAGLLFIYDPKYRFWSIEHHLLCFYFKHGKMIDSFNITRFVTYIMNYSLCGDLFVLEDVCKYYHDLLYEKDPDTVAQQILLNSYKTWDLYSLAYICYDEMTNKKLDKIPEYMKMLKQALHYDYTKRPNILTQTKIFTQILRDNL